MNKFICRFTFPIIMIGIIFSSFICQSSVKANQCSTPSVIDNAVLLIQPKSPSCIDFKWAGFLSITSNLYPIKKGRAEFYTGSLPLKGSYYTTITMKLQKYKSGKWQTIKTGSTKGKGSQLYSNHYYVSKGYKYRCTSTLKIYKSKGGSLLNKETISTCTRKY